MTPIRISSILGFLAVAMGAFGAHMLKSVLEANDTASIWQTAVFYHLTHSIAGLWVAGKSPLVFSLWTSGILIFSGTLYVLAITNIRWLGAITPIGGLLLIAGWAVLIAKPPRS
jgi:uncharacterized membrane protein YgdD (TMEM256/DUF423 family)